MRQEGIREKEKRRGKGAKRIGKGLGVKREQMGRVGERTGAGFG